MRSLWFLLVFSSLLIACESDDSNSEIINEQKKLPPTESLIELRVKYGSKDRQFLDIYKAESTCATPIYFDAHGNGGTTAVPESLVKSLNDEGITIIAWESLTAVNTPEQVETGWNDAALMFQWVIDNAETYNLDTSNIIVGGSSRGSILSWPYGHKPNLNIKGLYMYNALPNTVWLQPEWWLPSNNVTSLSPPIFFVYHREPGSSIHPTDADFHDPKNGITIVDQYESLGIGSKARLVHSIRETNNTDRYQYLLEFALAVMDKCP